MRIVTYSYKSVASGSTGFNTTLIDVPLIEWWQQKMADNAEYEARLAKTGQTYYETIALLFSEEIPDGEYPDIEWYSLRREV